MGAVSVPVLSTIQVSKTLLYWNFSFVNFRGFFLILCNIMNSNPSCCWAQSESICFSYCIQYMDIPQSKGRSLVWDQCRKVRLDNTLAIHMVEQRLEAQCVSFLLLVFSVLVLKLLTLFFTIIILGHCVSAACSIMCWKGISRQPISA